MNSMLCLDGRLTQQDPAVPGQPVVVTGAQWALDTAVSAARDWRGNGRKAYSSEGANSYG